MKATRIYAASVVLYLVGVVWLAISVTGSDGKTALRNLPDPGAVSEGAPSVVAGSIPGPTPRGISSADTSGGVEAARRLIMPEWLGNGPEPSLYAHAAVLLDVETGTVLYANNARAEIPPASLTKLVAIHVAYRLESMGVLDFSERVRPAAESWARNMPENSSLMFLGPGQRLTVWELLEGMAVASGNDAAYAFALHVSDSIQDFASLMNTEMERLGLSSLHFDEPSGLSSGNRVTARGFARFLKAYVDSWPEALDKLHSRRSLTYPEREHYDGRMAGRAITQYNRNPLLWDYEGVDGLKTGYIHASGYNFAVSARRDGRRLVGVILGVRWSGNRSGKDLRERDARLLLDYGFEQFELRTLRVPEAEPIRVWQGDRDFVQPFMADAGLTNASRAADERLTVIAPKWLDGPPVARYDTEESPTAPVPAGAGVGELRVEMGNSLLRSEALVTRRSVARGSFLQRTLDVAVRELAELGVPAFGKVAR